MSSSTSSSPKRRFAIVGTGGRSYLFTRALATSHAAEGELVAFCDINPVRMAYYNRVLHEEHGHPPVPTYGAEAFEAMVAKERPDVVIVTTIDRLHHHYIIRAMELGCDVITEKPMTIDAPRCRAILDAVERTGRRLQVAFNYRYSPARSKLKELLLAGAIGEVRSVHFEWLLDTKHGADYFRRWHRDKRNSGGLMVHKATHHFDLVNWWLASTPQSVFAFGDLAFYGRENAERRGITEFYDRGTGSETAKGCPFALDLTSSENLRGLYLDAETADGYRRDQSVFGDGISIEDTMNVAVRYRSGAQMSYSLHAYAPWEGYRVALNGTAGRIELNHHESSYINAANGDLSEGASHSHQLLFLPHFGQPEIIPIPEASGGHGGGDALLLDALFLKTPPSDPLGCAADHLDGARSILTGIAANQSIATGKAVKVDDLITL